MAKVIVNNSNPILPQRRKITWQRLEDDSRLLARKMHEIKFDCIVAISRGGLVVARILSDLLVVKISHITIESYKDFRQEKHPVITEFPNRMFKNETILIVDELSDTGRTFERALGYFNNQDTKKIYTSCLYIKPHTSFIPDFYAAAIDAWIVFPYEIRETADALLCLKQKGEKNHKSGGRKDE